MDSISVSGTELPERPAVPEYGKRQRWIDLVLVMLVGFTIPILNSTFLLLHPEGLAFTQSFVNFRLSIGLTQEGLALAVFAYVLSRQGRTLKSIGLDFRWHDPFTAVLLAIGGLGLYYLTGILIWSISYALTGRFPEARNIVVTAGASMGLTVAYILMSPIFEEVLIRGFFINELTTLGKPVWLAAVTSVLIQTSYHFYYGVPGALTVSCFFIVFTAYFCLTRRLFPVILAHFFLDSIGIFFLRHH